jgi:hypothetical protein
MKYIKLYEEFKGSRIKPTSEEKKKLREIARVIIKYSKDGKLSSGINEKYKILFDLGELKNLIGNLYNGEELSYQEHEKNGYKLLDDFAKKLSEERGVEIIFDKKNNCFTTSSGKAMTTVNVVSEYPTKKDGTKKTDGTAGYQDSTNHFVWVNYETGDIVNETPEGEGYNIAVLDFTSDRIFMSINQNIRFSGKDRSPEKELENIFSTLYHELIHSKDPLVWKNDYLGNKEVYSISGENGGVYYSHDAEVQTLSNEFLEVVEYYFERTLRGDTDGGGVNYNLTKEDINGVFIPNILEIVDFIDGKIDKLSDRVLQALKNKSSLNSVLNRQASIVNMRNEDPEDGKVIRQWMRDDFNHFVDYYNTRVIEINKRKEKGQELPLLHKGFPFEVTPVKPTPANVTEVTDAIEPTKPTNRPGISAATPVRPVEPVNSPSIGRSKFKFVSNATSKSLPTKFDLNEIATLMERYLRILGLAYSKCYIDRYKSPKTSVEVDTALKTLLREVKTRDIKRIREAIETFFDMISPKISDGNVKNWLNTSDGRKWGEAISQFEKMCSLA